MNQNSLNQYPRVEGPFIEHEDEDTIVTRTIERQPLNSQYSPYQVTSPTKFNPVVTITANSPHQRNSYRNSKPHTPRHPHPQRQSISPILPRRNPIQSSQNSEQSIGYQNSIQRGPVLARGNRARSPYSGAPGAPVVRMSQQAHPNYITRETITTRKKSKEI